MSTDRPTQEDASLGSASAIPKGAGLPIASPPSSDEEQRATGKGPSGGAVPDSHVKFAEETHQYVREYIRNADQKASFFFAASTAGVAYLLSHDSMVGWFKPGAQLTSQDLLGLVAEGALSISAGIFIGVVFPRLKASGRGIVFFNAIAAFDSAVYYAQAVVANSSSEIAFTKLQHVFDLARVCARKYRLLRSGFWIGSVGAVAALLFLVLRANQVVPHPP